MGRIDGKNGRLIWVRPDGKVGGMEVGGMEGWEVGGMKNLTTFANDGLRNNEQ